MILSPVSAANKDKSAYHAVLSPYNFTAFNENLVSWRWHRVDVNIGCINDVLDILAVSIRKAKRVREV